MSWTPGVSSVLVFLAGWLAGWVLLWPWRSTLPHPTDATRLPVAIVIPARNEAHNLAALLGSITPQLRTGDEIIVVDDHSQDATAEVAAANSVRVVAAPALPEGWAGKCWACWTGANATSAPTLIFLDADVTLTAEVIDRVVPPDNQTLVSVQPWHDARHPYEKLAVMFNIVAVMGSGALALVRRRGIVAFGPVLVTSRVAYERTGGHSHRDVRGSVTEDIALAARYDRVEVSCERQLASFRMYPSGIGSLIEGFTKNIAVGAGAIEWWVFVAVVAWVASVAGGFLASAWFYLATVGQVWVLGRRVGRFGLSTAVFAPVLVALFVVVFVRSALLGVLGRDVSWRGRRLSTRRAPPRG